MPRSAFELKFDFINWPQSIRSVRRVIRVDRQNTDARPAVQSDAVRSYIIRTGEIMWPVDDRRLHTEHVHRVDTFPAATLDTACPMQFDGLETSDAKGHVAEVFTTG